MDLQKLALKEGAREGGVWLAFADAELLLARTNNPAYLTELAEFYRKNKVAIDKGLVDDLKSDVILCEILARTIFKGFRNFTEGSTGTGAKKKPTILTDSFEERVRLLQTYPALREEIARMAGEFSNFQAEGLETAGKSSPGDSEES